MIRGESSSAVGTTTGYGLDDREFEVPFPVMVRIISSLYTDKFLSLHSNLSNGCWDLFPRDKAVGA
jgi:hypothetical protein